MGDSPSAFLVGTIGSVARLSEVVEAVEKSVAALRAIADSLQQSL